MLRIYLLGSIKMEANGVSLKLPLPSTHALWAYLLLHRQPLQREQLAQILWSDEMESIARARLSRQLYRLRDALPPSPPAPPLIPVDGSSDADWIITTATTVQWNPAADYWLDVVAFEQSSGHPATLDEAAQLYGGDLLPGNYNDWLLHERERLRQLYLAALAQLVARARAAADYPHAIDYARRLLAVDPLHEAVVRQLMSAHYQAGDRAAALAEYDRFTNFLAAELEATPMPETAALYEAILRNVSLPGSVAAEPPATLRPTAAPALPFVGREEEMARLAATWRRAARGQGGLLLISGEAGIGKSRLAAELAAQVEAEGGRVLAGSTSADEANPYQAIVAALRPAVPLLAPPTIERGHLRAVLPLLPELAARLRLSPLPRIEAERERERLYLGLADTLAQLAASHPLLIILEDLHWAGAATVQLLDFLAPYIATQPILIVATYREEEVARLHPLRALRRRVEQQGMGSSLALGSITAPATAQLAQSVDSRLHDWLYRESEGNPLFLSELIASLRENDTDTDMSSANLPQGVHSVIQARISRLDPNPRLLAEVASIGGVSFNLEVVRELAGWAEREVLDALGQLLDRSLVRDIGGRGVDYRFAHHLIQATVYSGIDVAVRTRRHRRLAFVLAELYAERGDELAATLARHFDLGAEAELAVPHYLAAARHALALYADDEALAAASRAAELTAQLPTRFNALALAEGIHHRRGEREAQVDLLNQMSIIAAELDDEQLTCEVLRRRIAMHSVLGEREEEARLIDELVALAPNAHWQAVALELRADYLSHLGQYDAARAVGRQAAAAYEGMGDTTAQVRCYCLLAEGYAFQGQFAEAEQLTAAAQVITPPDDQALLVRILAASANAAARYGSANTTYELSLQQLEVCRAIHDQEGAADAHSLAGRMAIQLSRFEEAISHFAHASHLYAQLGKRIGAAGVLQREGLLHFRLGHYAACLNALRQAEELHRQLDDLRGQVNVAISIAGVANDAHDYATAKVAAQHSLAFAEAMNSPSFAADAHSNLGVAAFGLAEAGAPKHLQTALAIKQASHSSHSEDTFEEICYLAAAYLQAGDLTAAAQQAAVAIAIHATRGEQIPKPHYAYWVMACVQHAQGDEATAHEYLQLAHEHYTRWFADREEKLSGVSDGAWRDFYRDLSFHPDLLAAYERDEWPPYAIPPPSPQL